MSIEWKMESDNLAVFNVSGKLERAEHKQILLEIESITQKTDQIKILVLLNNFDGWGAAADWSDTTINDRIDPHISKFAIVGNEKWREIVTLFARKGQRPMPIEYFGPDLEDTARQWLEHF